MLGGLGLAGLAAQLAIVVHAPDTVRVCDAVDVSVAVAGRATDVPRLWAPSFRPFDVLRATTAPRVTRAGAPRPDIVAEYRFVLTTDRPGQFMIPAFEARDRDGRVGSRPLTITVLPRTARGAPAVVTRARMDTAADAGLLTASAETVFVGQQATYEVAVFLNQVMRERLRRNPTFYPPEMRSMLAYDLPPSAQGFRENSGSRCFDALVYRRAVFPLVAGRLVIPPAQLVYSTALSSTSLFSREESHELQTDSVSIVAVEPPLVGRPSEYGGAVGAVRIESRLDSLASRVGDPMLLTVRVVGSGNVKLFPRPGVRVPWASLVAADERVAVDSTSVRVGGAKEFDWVLTPRVAGEFDLPPVRYGYFDPGRRRYDVAVTPAERVRVAMGALASADTGQADGPMTIRTVYSGPAAAPPHSRTVFWLALALVPLPALVARARGRLRRVRRVAAADAMRALAVAAASEDPGTLRRTFVRALAQRLGCRPSDFTHPGALERALRRAGVSDSTASRAEAHLRALDAAAWAPAGVLPLHAAREADLLARAVDAEALSRGELPFRVPVLLMLAVVASATAAIAADSAPAAFASGVSSYLRQDYAAARDAFAEAATLAPRAADAWANYGTASWAAGDTTSAVHGWRQAVSLEPDARDVRSRLHAVRPIAVASAGWAPALPAHVLVWLCAALWAVAWAAAWRARRASAVMPRRAAALAAMSVVVGLGAMEVDARVSGADAAVVRRTLALMSDPAVGMDRGAVVGTGELVRVVMRSGAWARVEATDARAGWVPDASLILLADRRIPRD